jgi:thioredoxin-like negative regulator of GroEL
MLAPIFENQVKPAYSNVRFEDIDVDDNQNEAMKYNVRSVPTVVILKEGVEVQRFTGVSSPMAYKNAINEHLK